MGEIRVKFFDPDTLAARDLGAVTYLIGVTGRSKMVAGRIGSGTVKIAIPELAKLTGAYLFIQQHDICVFYLNDGSDRRLGQFVIRSVKLEAGGAGQPSYFTLSGPDPLYYLGKVTNHLNIGEEFAGTVNASTGISPGGTELQVDYGDIQDEDTDDPSPFWPKYTIKKAQTLQIGDGVLQLIKASEAAKAAGEQWANGDAIWISQEDGVAAYDNVFKTHITATPVVGVDYLEVTLGETSPVSIKSGDRDSPENYFPMFKPHIFAGDPIRVQQADSSWHTSKAERIAYRGIILESGPTGTVNAGAQFIWRDVRTPNTTNDITRIMENATAWTVSGAASSKGTAHKVDGQSTFDLLEAAAKATGDHFYASQASATAPNLTLTWVASSPSSGLTLIEPTQAAMQATVASSTNIIIHSISRVSKDLPTTRVIPQGAESDEILAHWGLDLCDETAVQGLKRLYDITAIDGMTTEYVNGAWRVRNTTSLIQSEETIKYDIIPVSESMEDLIEGSNRLQAAAALQLHVKRDTERLFDITTVLPAGVDVNPGETLTLTYTNNEWVESKTLYIAEYEYFVQNTGSLRGLRQCRMILSEYGPYPRETGAILVARAMKQGLGGSGNVQVGAGGGGSIVPGEAVTIASSTPSNALTAAGSELTFLATSDGETNPSTVLYADANGRIRVDGLGIGTAVTGGGLQMVGDATINGDLDFIGPQAITTDSGDLSVSPAGDLVVSADLLFAGAHNIETSSGDLGLNPVGDLTVNADLVFIGPQQITTNSGDLGLNPVGDLTVNADLVFTGAQSIKTSADSLTVAPANNLILDPVGDNVLFPTTVDTSGQNWVSGFLGTEWGIDTGLGHLDIRSIYADELRVTLFSADETLVVAGSHYVSPGMGRVATAFVVPAVSSSTTVVFRDSVALGATAIFRENDKGFIRVSDTTAGGATFALVWGTVTGYSDNGDGTQDWTWTTGALGAAVGGDTVPAESVFVDLGQPGMGWWSVTTNDITSGPHADITTWHGASPWNVNNRTNHIRLGDLNGIAGIGHEYGLYAGVSPAGPRVIISDTNAEFHQIPLSLYSGTSDSGVIRVYALELNSSAESAIEPDGDVSQTNVARSSGTGTYYSHINENPASGQPDSQWLVNTGGLSAEIFFTLEDISHTLTTLELEAFISPQNFTDDVCTLVAQIFKSNGTTSLTDEIKVANQDFAESLVIVPFTGIDTTASDAEWAAARLKLKWVYHVSGGTEVIRLEPSMEDGPYIAVGGTLPTSHIGGGDGVWMGRYPGDGTYKARFGGTATSGLPRMVWTGSDLVFRNGASNDPVIEFSSTGDSYFAGTMTIDTAGEIVSGATVFDYTGITIGSYAWGGSPVSTEKIKFKSGTTDVAYIQARYDTGSSYENLRLGTDSGELISLDSLNGLTVESQSDIVIRSGTASDILVYGASGGISLQGGLNVNSSGPGQTADDGDIEASGGMILGWDASYGAPTKGQLILDQGALDGVIFKCISSDFNDWSAQAMDSAGTYFQIQKSSAANGGAILRAGSDLNYALWLIGSSQTADATQSTSSVAPVIIRGAVDNSGVGTDNNAVVMQSYNATRWIMKGDGQIYNDYSTSMTAFDDEVDIGLVRASAYAIGGGGVIHDRWDDFVTYNRDDLARLDIVTKTGFVNQQNMTKLLIGNAWQQHTEVQELKERLVALERRIVDA